MLNVCINNWNCSLPSEGPTLNRKFLRWSGPLWWTKTKSGCTILRLLHNSMRADTGCFPRKHNGRVSGKEGMKPPPPSHMVQSKPWLKPPHSAPLKTQSRCWDALCSAVIQRLKLCLIFIYFYFYVFLGCTISFQFQFFGKTQSMTKKVWNQ